MMLRPIYRSVLRTKPLRSLAAASPARSVGPQATRQYATGDNDVFLQSNNANYIDEMYSAWKKDPESVHVSWQAYFKNLDGGVPSQRAFQPPPNIVPTSNVDALPSQGSPEVLDHLRVQMLVRAYQVSGHFRAKVDPLKRSLGFDKSGEIPKEFDIKHYGWTEGDLDREISLGPGILPRFAKDGQQKTTIRKVIEYLDKTYCGSYGIQYMHIPSREQSDWLRDRVEIPTPFSYSKDEKRRILDRLMWSSLFEEFLHTKFPNDKRFGLEGGETLVPGMKELIDRSVDFGVEDVVMGMPHRGRLNVLSNVVRKPNQDIFSEFAGSAVFDEGSGDVKYHLGMNYQRPTSNGKKVNLLLAANPSHLEAEDPVVLGQTRAIQHFKKDVDKFDKAMGLLLHGDAAVEAQGVVYETLGFCQLKNYRTGGTIHVIVNNQIGFTTDPKAGRSTPYPSDFAKSIDAPIFHVNGDDAESVVFIFNLAAEWRAKWKSDVIIDLICYRKYGHNEIDQPSFTQPLMYKEIGKKKAAIDLYTEQLVKEGTFTEEDIKEHRSWIWDLLEDSFKRSRDAEAPHEEHKWVTTPWEDFKSLRELRTEILPHEPTSLPVEQIKELGVASSSWPESFNVHRNLKRILNTRIKTVEQGKDIDWATAEAIAFGSLLKEGHHVRVSGQDVERGTFSQRHAVLHDQETGETHTPLKTFTEDPDQFVISNSHLSEYGVLGYEYGYSLTDPRALIMWEAQFGDFANTAQVIIDQFIAAAESKWGQRSGIVMSLPHGYDGQGPEHSSARLERYLQLGDEDPRYFPTEEALHRQHQDCNIQVAYPTTPANYFHLLRRQQHRQFRKPLIMLFSKALLRHPLARSNIEEFTGDSGFQWIIEDPELGKGIGNKEDITRLVLCSGQVWTFLHKERAERGIKDVAVTRVEQLHPFPWQQLKESIDSYPNLKEVVWTQEEPLNAGAWTYVYPRLDVLLKETKHNNLKAKFVSRDPNASVAAGTKSMHKAEEEAMVNESLTTSP